MSESEQVQLTVKGEDGNKVTFKVKKTIDLSKVLAKFCEKQKIEASAAVALYYNGKRVEAGTTAEKLGLEDQAELAVKGMKSGGSAML